MATGYDENDYDYYAHDYENLVYESAASNECEVINIFNSSNFCANIPSYPLSIWTASGNILSGIPIICGGELQDQQHEGRRMVDSCYTFNVTTNSWKFLSKMSKQRADFASVALKGALWVTGGNTKMDEKGSHARSHDKSTEFVYLNGSVSQGPDLPTARDDHCMVTLPDDRIMILGSDGGMTNPNSVVVYDPEAKEFLNASPMLYARDGAGCVLIYSPLHGNRPVVLVAGGKDMATAEILDYTYTNSWEESKEYLISIIQLPLKIVDLVKVKFLDEMDLRMLTNFIFI